MANGYNDNDVLNATWKEVCAPEINKLIPSDVVLMKEVSFNTADKLGDKFIEPVQVQAPQGITHLGTASSVETLLSAAAGKYVEAQIDGYGLVGRESISYSTAAKMASDKAAFVKWANLIAPSLKESVMKRLEIEAIWGQHLTGLGVISGVSNNSGTCVCSISAATWSSSLWGGMEGCTLDALDATFANKINTNAKLTVSAVDFANKTVTVTGNSTDTAALLATHVLVFEGSVTAGVSPTYKGMVGLAKQVSNTSATIWNIAAGTYSLWRGNTYSTTGALTMAKVLAAAGLCAARGLKTGLDVFVSVDSYNNMNADQAALRVYDSSYKPVESESGSDKLVFHGPAGKLAVRPHLYMKNGYALGVPMQSLKRIGSTDVTFDLPGKNDGEIFLHIPDKSGYEMRCFSEQAIYTNKPCHGVLISGIS